MNLAFPGVEAVKTLLGAAVQRHAFYLSSNQQPVFAWLHVTSASTNHGIVLCPSIGHEHIHGHRTLCQLADALARAGYPVLRIDYHGIGDSAGTDEDPHRVATWLQNVRDALDWIRSELGCTSTSLVGLRVGALLALRVATEEPVTNLVLWAPPLKGQTYVREMQALSMTSAAPASESNDLEAGGFVLTDQTARDLADLNVLESRPKCSRALIVARDDRSEERRLLDHFISLGLSAVQIRPTGYADMLAEPHQAHVPQRAIDSIVAWFAESPKDGSLPEIRLNPSPKGDTSTMLPGPSEVSEQIIQFEGLAGILCRPTQVLEDRPWIVLLNAGATHHAGPNRLHVHLTRYLATRGFASLRMDLGGLGDSLGGDPWADSDVYSARIFHDLHQTLEYAQEHLGARRLVLMGLCSGAYFAFQAAAQFSNPSLVESILINPLTFYWKDGMTLEASPVREIARYQYYLDSALQPSKWWKLISGQTQIGRLGAIKLLVRRLLPRKSSAAAVKPTPARWQENDAKVSHPQEYHLPTDLEQVVGWGRHLACFFSASDPGYPLLMQDAGSTVKLLRRAGNLDIHFIERVDHTFSRRDARKQLLREIADYLSKRYAM